MSEVMETEKDEQILERTPERRPSQGKLESKEADIMVDEIDTKILELKKRKEREENLKILLSQKDKESKDLVKQLKDLKQRLLEIQTEEREKTTELRADVSLVNEIKMMKNKIAEKGNRQQFLDKEMENYTRSRSDDNPNFINKYLPNYGEYSKYKLENEILENYVRSESYRASIDMIQSLKQTAEQITNEIEKASVTKGELDIEKQSFEESLKKFRNEYKQLRDDNEKLAEDIERRKMNAM